MDKFFVIPPINHMDLTEYANQKSLYCLAHLCLQRNNDDFQQYIDFFKGKADQGYHVILDNSAAEDSLIDKQTLLNICEQILPTEVVAPDHLYDCHKTQNALDSFLRAKRGRGSLLTNVKVHAVPQGDSPISYLKSYIDIVTHPDVDVIGLSKLSVPQSFKHVTDTTSVSVNRRYLISLLNQLDLLKKPVHLLGMRNITEYKSYKGIDMIRSTDSCYTILSAVKGEKLEKDKIVDNINSTPHDYFYMKLDDQTIKIAKYNILQLSEIIRQTKKQ